MTASWKQSKGKEPEGAGAWIPSVSDCPRAHQLPQDDNGNLFRLFSGETARCGTKAGILGHAPGGGHSFLLCELGDLLNLCVMQTFHLKMGVKVLTHCLQWTECVPPTFTLNTNPLGDGVRRGDFGR